jgi:hypothetical protein
MAMKDKGRKEEFPKEAIISSLRGLDIYTHTHTCADKLNRRGRWSC